MNRLLHLMSPRRMPLLLAVACILAVAAAMTMQQVFDYRPCPWCILQRMIFLSIALLCIATAMSPSRRLRMVLNALTLLPNIELYGAMPELIFPDVRKN